MGVLDVDGTKRIHVNNIEVRCLLCFPRLCFPSQEKQRPNVIQKAGQAAAAFLQFLQPKQAVTLLLGKQPSPKPPSPGDPHDYDDGAAPTHPLPQDHAS